MIKEMRDNFTFDSGVSDLSVLPDHFVDGPKELEIKSNVEDHDLDFKKHKLKCGWLWFRPYYLQKYRTAKWALFWLCWAGAIQGLVVNGLINVVITTIERRFGLSSSQTGLIAGGYDIASFFLLIPISYLGGRTISSKPRYIGVGVLVLGLGALLFASPHYFAGPYRGGHQITNTCHRVNNSHSVSCNESQEDLELEPSSGVYLLIFFVAQLLHGAGAVPFFTLGVTYLDENVSKKMSSVYLGIYYTMAVIGPALGYVIGGELLKLYTDFLIVDVSTIGLTPYSNVWVGAWWIGFLACAIVCFVIAIPLLAFPAVLPGSEELSKDKISEAHETSKNSINASEAFSKIHDLTRALQDLLRNPAFFMLNLAGASEGFLIAGFASFLPKLIENQFSVNVSTAALLMGFVTVPAGGGGTFLGGYLIKRWNLSCLEILKFCIICTAVCLIFTFAFVLSCPNLDFAGLTIPYSNQVRDSMTLESSCNTDCGCISSQFNPICGINGVTYFSPCYAGCNQEIELNDLKVYSECKCISSSSLNMTSVLNEKVMSYSAINIKCNTSCWYIYLFMALSFCNMFLTFLCTMPALSGTLRVVRDEQKSFALGIQLLKVRILGTIPAPIIFGTLIDEACILWQDTTEGKGACLVYDNFYLSRYMFALSFIGKVASLAFFFFAWKFYKPPNDVNAKNCQYPVATVIVNNNQSGQMQLNEASVHQ
ncbi:solute carrier organic anion transporter family member 4A1 isoform X2 [Leptopilina boulardi]|uniref:solute carrier organic anion transporter family member 4A1 isoform X2 n=1 Tax=Leptopilina boulardi TaxID=63433 RepID=UPI0021F5ECCD|nr:solute carrier organic anion transporter family member 4A1 isoform X2 [Leptopilina boulardi]